MTDHGLRGLHPLQWLEWTQTHYPWSVLWILFMVGVALLITGLLFAAALVALLFLIVGAQGLRWRRSQKTR
jgi:hypothetical protein